MPSYDLLASSAAGLAEYVGRFDYREELRELGDAIRAVTELQRVLEP